MKNILLSAIAAGSLAASLASSLAGAAQAAPAAAAREARVPIFQIRDYQPQDRETLYVQTRSRTWFRVETMGRCEALPWAHNIAIDRRSGSSLDRFSTLLVERERCPVASVVASGPPPRSRPKLRD